MKAKSILTLGLCATLMLSGCDMSKTASGSLIGTAAGGLLGAAVGYYTGNTAVGAAVGATVGAGAGALIGHKMDKAAEAAAQVEGADVEKVKDANGLEAVKVTFDSGLLFATGKSDLSSGAKASLTKFAGVLKEYSDADVAVQGYTDNQGWRNSTAEQSVQKNLTLSQQRADAVSSYLKDQGVSADQIASSTGFGESNPVADNSTAEGKAQNRRVEVYLYASEEMIKAAEAGTLK